MLDKFLMFDDASQHLTTEASTNLIDLSAARNMAVGTPLWFVIHVTTAFTDSGSDSTMAITLETDTAAAFSSATTAQTIGTFAALAAAGATMMAPLQVFGTAERFLRVKYTVANGDLSTGKFTAYLTSDIQKALLYAKNYTITS